MVFKISRQASKTIKSYIKDIVISARVGNAPPKLQASAYPRAEGVPTNNQTGRGAGPYIL